MKRLTILIVLFFWPLTGIAEQSADFPLVSLWNKENSGKSATMTIPNSTIVLYNSNGENTDFAVELYDSQWDKLGYSTGTLPTGGTDRVDILSLLSEGAATPAHVTVKGSGILCLLVEADDSGDRIAAVWPPDVGPASGMWINHIAPERNQFFTAFSILSQTDSELNWTDNEGTISLASLSAGEVKDFELGEIYPGTVPDDVALVSVSGTAGTAISGFESFGNWDSKKTFAILPATSFTNTRLIFPHIAYSKTLYWTGLVVGNPNSKENRVMLRFMDESGNVLQTQHTNIDPLKRVVLLFAGENTATPALPAPIPDGTAWLDVYGDHPLTGFELFGGNDVTKADYMEGIRATAEPFETGIAPYLPEGSNEWSGIAIVNALSLPVTVTMSLRGPDGSQLESADFTLNPFEKKVDLLRSFFTRENLAAGGSVQIHSSEPGAIVGIIVFGDDNVTPRRLLGGYEIMPLNAKRKFGPVKGRSSLPKFGINFPKFGEASGIQIPTQEELQNEFAWWSSGQPYRIATRQMQNRDVFYSEWIPENATARENFFRNRQGFTVMPTLIGFKAEWNGIGEPYDPIDMSNPEHVSRLQSYVRDVISTYPDIDYFEIFNETFGKDTLGTNNFAEILNTALDTAKSENPDVLISFPHLLGTIPSLLENALANLVTFATNHPDVLNKCDVYGLHYYGPWQQFSSIVSGELLAPMTSGALPARPWVITETGISNSTASDTVTATNGIQGGPENQAAYMVKMFTLSFCAGAELSMVHSVQSGSTGGGWAGYGLINADGTRTPASCTFRFFTDAVRDFTAVEPLLEGNDGIWLYRYNRANRLLGDAYVAWKDDGTDPDDTELTLQTLAGQGVIVTWLVPENCSGKAGDMAEFDPDTLFTRETAEVGDDGRLTLPLGQYPVLIQARERAESYTINIESSGSNGTIQNLCGVISGPVPVPETNGIDLTAQLQSIGITTIRNNDYYDDSLDIEGIFRCPDTSVYPSWDCDATDDSNYHWDASDTVYSAIVDDGFEPFFRLGGEVENMYNHHDFAGPRDETQENNWIIAAKKMVDRYRNWAAHPNAFQYLDIWTEWPNSDFWDRSNPDFIDFWAKAFREIKQEFPDYKVGGPGILKPTVDVIAGTSDNNLAVVFLNKLYTLGLKPDFISFHLWKNDPELFYRAATQFRALLNGTGDFQSVSWANTGFFNDVELICGAYGFGQLEDNEAGEPVEVSKEELFDIMNRKRGAAILTGHLIALQQGNVARAYYYRDGDPNSSPDAGPRDHERGWTGLFYGDANGTAKPSAYAFRLFSRLYSNFPFVISDKFVSIGDENDKIYYLAARGTNGIAVLLSNPGDLAASVHLVLDGLEVSPASCQMIQVYQVDNENDGSGAVAWSGNILHLPPQCAQLIVLTGCSWKGGR
ncbi:MAG: hypothetical protein GXO70_03455 [Acidobacteria bacterium]|nr:hypothetical protein [Acidobacteriota bacterium]